MPGDYFFYSTFDHLYFVRANIDTQTHFNSIFTRITVDQSNISAVIRSSTFNYFSAYGSNFNVSQWGFEQDQIHYNNFQFAEASSHINGEFSNFIARYVDWQKN